METQLKKTDLAINGYALGTAGVNGIDLVSNFFSRQDIISAFEKIIEFRNFFQQADNINPEDQLTGNAQPVGKKSFLVFNNNKYITVPTENIAFFYIKYESQYFVNYSLEQIQSLLGGKDFYRLNRQYLINFNAVKEVEHYFARKMLVNLTVPARDKLLVSKEKVSSFLHWLDNR
jgi:two-component system, LytTR family, response regulator LytT